MVSWKWKPGVGESCKNGKKSCKIKWDFVLQRRVGKYASLLLNILFV